VTSVTSGAGGESNPHVVLLEEASLQQLETRRAEYATLHPAPSTSYVETRIVPHNANSDDEFQVLFRPVSIGTI